MFNSATVSGPFSFVLLAVSATLMGLANLATKYAAGRASQLGGSYLFAVIRQPWFIVGLILVGCASVLWLKVIAMLGLTIAYPIFVGLTYVVVAIGSTYLLGEHMNTLRFAGVAALFLGIVLVSRS